MHPDPKSKENNENCTDTNHEQKFPLPAVNFKNEAISNASEKICIKYSAEMGRHLVANEDIAPGWKRVAPFLLTTFEATCT